MTRTLTPWSKEYQKKVILPHQLAKKVALLRQEGKKIATLNGSFDLMHAGHLYIVHEASQVADVLIVALNSDASIQKYKSPDRPIVTLDYRIQMMAALEFVDYVTWFDETDPCHLLSVIKPDVHVNGSEYGENCIEAQIVKMHGGTLHLVPRIPSLSTTEIIAKIKSLKD